MTQAEKVKRLRRTVLLIAGLDEASAEVLGVRAAIQRGDEAAFEYSIRKLQVYAKQIVAECKDMLKGEDNAD